MSVFFLYVDESGDPGIGSSPTRYFALSGIVIHELAWLKVLDQIVDFRKDLRNRYTLKLREEIHSAAFIHKPGELQRIAKSIRLHILGRVLAFEARMDDFNVINVVVDKQGKENNFDVFDHAWKFLFQRFHNTIINKNFRGPKNPDERGLVIVD
jgi:hypothetical protein